MPPIKHDNIMFEKPPTQNELNRFAGFIVEDDRAIVIDDEFNQAPLSQATAKELACYLIEARAVKDWADNIVTNVNKNMDTVAEQLGKLMIQEEQPVFKQTTPKGHSMTMRLKTDVRIGIRKDDEFNTVLAYAWLLKRGLSSIIKASIHPATLKACIEKYLVESRQGVNFVEKDDNPQDWHDEEAVEYDLNFITLFNQVQERVQQVINDPKYQDMLNSEQLPDCFTRLIVTKGMPYKR